MTDHTCPQCGYVTHAPEPQSLTRIQSDVLTFLRTFHGEHGYAPTFLEIAARFGYRSLATVHEHMETLERKGYIRRRFNEWRGIELTDV